MAANRHETKLAQQAVIQCSCGNRMLALTQHAGKRVKCSACGQVVVVAPQDDDQPQTTEQPDGISRATTIAAWSFVGVFALGSFFFLNVYSRSVDQRALALANEAKAIAERDTQAKQAHLQQLRLTANSNVERLFDEATEALEAGDIATSQRRVEETLATPHADNFVWSVQAKQLREQIQNAIDPARIHEALMGLSDEDFQQLRENGTMPPQLLTNYVALNRRAVELVKADIEGVAKTRDAPRLAKLEKERAELEKQREREKEAFAKLQQREKENAPPINLIQKKVPQKGGTWEAFNRECGQTAYSSNQVRAEALFAKNWQGKTVDWTGTVVAIQQSTFGSYIITCKMPDSGSLVSDVSYKLPEKFREKFRDSVLKLSKGDAIRFQGTIVRQGGVLLDHVVEYDE